MCTGADHDRVTGDRHAVADAGEIASGTVTGRQAGRLRRVLPACGRLDEHVYGALIQVGAHLVIEPARDDRVA
jgi:hypothetical protein